MKGVVISLKKRLAKFTNQVARSSRFGGVLLSGLVVLFALTAFSSPSRPNRDHTLKPLVDIGFHLKGASPQEVVKLALAPLEQAVGDIEGVEAVYSRAQRGRGRVSLQFAPRIDALGALARTQAFFNSDKSGKLARLDQLSIKARRLEPLLMTLTVWSDMVDVSRLNRTAQYLRATLAGQAGIARVELRGGVASKLMIDVSPTRLRDARLPVSRIDELVRAAQANWPRLFNSPQELGALAIGLVNEGAGRFPQGNVPVFLRDVAHVTEGLGEEGERIHHYSGPSAIHAGLAETSHARAMTLAVFSDGTGDQKLLARTLEARLNGLQNELAAHGVHLTRNGVDDKSQFVMRVDLPRGGSREATDQNLRQWADALLTIYEVTGLQIHAGAVSPAHPLDPALDPGWHIGSGYGQITVQVLGTQARRRSIVEIMAQARALTASLVKGAGAQVEFAASGQNARQEEMIVAQVSGGSNGSQIEVVRELIARLTAAGVSAQAGDENRAPVETLFFEADSAQLERARVSPVDLRRQLAMMMGEVKVTGLPGEEERAVYLRGRSDEIHDRAVMAHLPVRSFAGGPVALGELGRFARRKGRAVLLRKGGRDSRFVRITGLETHAKRRIAENILAAVRLSGAMRSDVTLSWSPVRSGQDVLALTPWLILSLSGLALWLFAAVRSRTNRWFFLQRVWKTVAFAAHRR